MSFGSKGPFDTLIRMLSGFPGLGRRSAARIVLHLLSKKESLLLPLIEALQDAANNIQTCTQCGNFDRAQPCHICQDHRRDESQLCVIAQVSDLWAIERTNIFRGRYHILGGVLSALSGITPEKLRFAHLIGRLKDNPQITELILGLGATVDGQSTVHYITDLIASEPELKERLKITKLSHGVPMGGELDYLDEGTISLALRARQ